MCYKRIKFDLSALGETDMTNACSYAVSALLGTSVIGTTVDTTFVSNTLTEPPSESDDNTTLYIVIAAVAIGLLVILSLVCFYFKKS